MKAVVFVCMFALLHAVCVSGGATGASSASDMTGATGIATNAGILVNTDDSNQLAKEVEYGEEQSLQELTITREAAITYARECRQNVSALKEGEHNAKLERESAMAELVASNEALAAAKKQVRKMEAQTKTATRALLDHEVDFQRFRDESKSTIRKMEREIAEKAKGLPVLKWVSKELKLKEDENSTEKLRMSKLIKKLRMELLVSRKVMEFTLRDARQEIERKEKHLRQKFEPFTKARAKKERDMKLAKGDQVRSERRLVAVKHVHEKMVKRHEESQKMVSVLEKKCQISVAAYKATEEKHEKALHTITRLKNELARTHAKPVPLIQRAPRVIPTPRLIVKVQQASSYQEQQQAQQVELGGIHNQEQLAREEEVEQARDEKEAMRMYKTSAKIEQRVRELRPSKIVKIPTPVSVEKQIEAAYFASSYTGATGATGATGTSTGATGAAGMSTGATGATGATGMSTGATAAAGPSCVDGAVHDAVLCRKWKRCRALFNEGKCVKTLARYCELDAWGTGGCKELMQYMTPATNTQKEEYIAEIKKPGKVSEFSHSIGDRTVARISQFAVRNPTETQKIKVTWGKGALASSEKREHVKIHSKEIYKIAQSSEHKIPPEMS